VIKPGSMVYTDEYDIYTRLPEWGFQHKCVNHSAGEYARDEACPEPAEGMAMAFTKSMSIQWKDFGLYCVHGYVHIVVFLKKNCLVIWVSLSSFTMSGGEEKPCCILSSLCL
jgi:hypothetical protein